MVNMEELLAKRAKRAERARVKAESNAESNAQLKHGRLMERLGALVLIGIGVGAALVPQAYPAAGIMPYFVALAVGGLGLLVGFFAFMDGLGALVLIGIGVGAALVPQAYPDAGIIPYVVAVAVGGLGLVVGLFALIAGR
jgi:hypothetical protein